MLRIQADNLDTANDRDQVLITQSGSTVLSLDMVVMCLIANVSHTSCGMTSVRAMLRAGIATTDGRPEPLHLSACSEIAHRLIAHL